MCSFPARLARAAMLIAIAAPAPLAAADPGKPQLLPTRDVDVNYSIVQGGKALPQRVRWTAIARLLRIDPPIPGLFVIVDYDRKRMSMVREAEHIVVDMEAPENVLMGVQNRLDTTTRGKEERIAGLACTNWQTTDLGNKPAAACLTPDGVLLQVRSQGEVVLTANSVRFEPQAASTFRVPDDFFRIPAGKAMGGITQ